MRNFYKKTLSFLLLALLYSAPIEAQIQVLNANTAAGASANPSQLVDLNGILYYVADNGTNGNELWRSDGTAAGTYMVKDIMPGTLGSSITSLTKIGSELYFSADGGQGTEFWKSDGTAAGTFMVKEISPGITSLGQASSAPSKFTKVNNTTFFVAYKDGTSLGGSIAGAQLWKTDGTTAGTEIVLEISLGITSDIYITLLNYNNLLYFLVHEFSNNTLRLWKSDGTVISSLNPSYVGTEPIIALSNGLIGPNSMQLANGKLYFWAQNTDGVELWSSNGTAAGTSMIKNINPTGNAAPLDYSPSIAYNGEYYFIANDGINGEELWKTDGTAANTTLVSNIGSGASNAEIKNMIVYNGALYFTANGTSGLELWKTNGTSAGTQMLTNINNTSASAGSDPGFLTEYQGLLYFNANNGINGHELWKSEGTAAGTVMASDIATNVEGNPTKMKVSNGALYMSAQNNTDGYELWKLGPCSSLPQVTSFVANNVCNDLSGYVTIDLDDAAALPVTLNYQLGANIYQTTVNTHAPIAIAPDFPDAGYTYTITQLTDANGCTRTSGFTDNTATIDPNNFSFMPQINTFDGQSTCGNTGTLQLTVDLIDMGSGMLPVTMTYTDGTNNYTQTITDFTPQSFTSSVAGTFSVVSLQAANGCLRNTGFLDNTAQALALPVPSVSFSTGFNPHGNINSDCIPQITVSNNSTFDIEAVQNMFISNSVVNPDNFIIPAGGTYTILPNIYNRTLYSIHYVNYPSCIYEYFPGFYNTNPNTSYSKYRFDSGYPHVTNDNCCNFISNTPYSSIIPNQNLLCIGSNLNMEVTSTSGGDEIQGLSVHNGITATILNNQLTQATNNTQLINLGPQNSSSTLYFKSLTVDFQENFTGQARPLFEISCPITITVQPNPCIQSQGISYQGAANVNGVYVSVYGPGNVHIGTEPYNNGNFTLPALSGAGNYQIVLHVGSSPSLTPSLPAGYTFNGDLYGGVLDGTANGLITITLAANGSTTLQNTRLLAATDISFNIGGSSALPVQLISFEGTSSSKANILNWQASSETDFSHYLVQKSENNSDFASIGTVKGGNLKNEKSTYSYTDTPTAAYYRLQMVDQNGKSSFSNIIYLDGAKPEVEVGELYPNPSIDKNVQLVVKTNKAGVWKVKILDGLGRQSANHTIQLNKGLNLVPFELQDTTGLQYILLEYEGKYFTRKILKQ
jgi:ELWxxDGT repeat protein